MVLASLRSVVIYGATGLGFAGANLILARVASTAEYAGFAYHLSLPLLLVVFAATVGAPT